LRTDYDYIIVGAGAAGCVLADKLSASGKRSVLLLEAGPLDKSPFIHMPRGVGALFGEPKYFWRYAIEPDPGNGDKVEFWLRGKTLGGSGAVNGMVYNRGRPEDYDQLETAGCVGWNWSTMLRHFRANEDHVLGASESRGAGGPVRISMPSRTNPFYEAVLDNGAAIGLERVEDVNDHRKASVVGYCPWNVKNGRRWSSAMAFLRRERSRRNLKVLTGALVDKLSFQRQRTTGVKLADGRAFRANREVILAAGAIASPMILQRSGVGPRDLLDRLGIPVVAEAPEVGQNILDHRCISLQFRVTPQASFNQDFRLPKLLWNVLFYWLTGKGPMSGGSFDLQGYMTVLPQSSRPDAQLLMSGFSLSNAPTSRRTVESKPGFTCLAFPLRPISKGQLAIRSTDPADTPVIRANYFAHPEERAIAVGIVRTIRAYMGLAALKRFVVEEINPGAAVRTDEQILEAWGQRGGSGLHAVGSCRMGSDAHSVVDPDLRVRGIEGVRVADLSVLPVMPSGNTNGPVMALAGRAAEIILKSDNELSAPGDGL